jgi:aspartyl/asparaginyl beta-hydroxylase (cupin superfamily)
VIARGAAALVDEADRATAAGDLKLAEKLLLDASAASPEDTGLWLKIAALQRATGRPQEALRTVDRALSINPRDFTALLLRASLLERLNQPGAIEAWAHALAQKPPGETPPHLRQVVADAQSRVERWTAQREATMSAAMAASEQAADAEARERLQRFRSNVLMLTRPYHSEPTHFHFPALAEREFYPRRLFPWIGLLEQASEAIAGEMRAVMASECAELVPYVQYAKHLPLEQWRELNNNRDWTAIHLLKNGERVEANARLCPKTMEIIAKCDQPVIRGASPNAMFSLLAPNTAIPPHVGVSNTRLVCHLPLQVPDGCWFRVGAERRFWKAGEAFVFDDTIEHEALNPTDQLRVVFICDIWRPELSQAERAGVTALMEADGIPGGQA